MKKHLKLTICFSLAILMAVSAAPVFAMGGASGIGGTGDGSSSGPAKDSSMDGQMSGDHSGQDSMHHGIESGRDFGQHVSEHNDKFSGSHNPGVHHKGYSGIKD